MVINTKAFLNTLPSQPGIYQMLDDHEKIIYIGKALNLKKRISNYFLSRAKDLKTEALLKHVKDIQVIITHSDNEALLLECNLIKKYKPHYNVLFRDDKSYPYIILTDDAFPRIDLYRGNKKEKGRYFGPFPNGAAVRETIRTIQKLFQLRTCSDSFYTSRTRPCLHHQIGHCSGPCGKRIAEEEYQRNVHHAILFLEGKSQLIIDALQKQMQTASNQLHFEAASRLRDQILKLRHIQERQYVIGSQRNADVLCIASAVGIIGIQLVMIRGGRVLGSRAYFPSVPSDVTLEEVLTSFVTQHYLGVQDIHDIPKEIILDRNIPERSWLQAAITEKAKQKVILLSHVRGERKKWLEISQKNAKQAIESRLLNKNNIKERLGALKTALDLNVIPQRIECVDISHSMGEETMGSCVAFDTNGPMKSDYRRYHITHITKGDDLAAMQQVIRRRFKLAHENTTKLPDILLIDGGKPQLAAVQTITNELGLHTILLVAVAKGATRKAGFETLYLPNHTPIHLSPDSLALHCIQQIRDEAHRFAITGHRHRRDKKRVTSSLESIPSIGAKRRRELLRYFGGIQAINRASLEELAKVPGISQFLAERIYAALH